MKIFKRITYGLIAILIATNTVFAKRLYPPRRSEITLANIRLLHASAAGNLTKVKMQIDLGADISTRDGMGETPLILATQNKHADVVRYFLAHHAQVNLIDAHHSTALIWAVSNCYDSIPDMLMAHEANANISDDQGMTPLLWLLDSDISLPETAEHRIVSGLLSHGAGLRINQKGAYGNAALMLAMERNDYSEVKEFLQAGADVNEHGWYGRTPVMSARSGKVAALLLAHGAKLEARDQQGETALIFTVPYFDSMLSYFIAHGASLNAQENDGDTALIKAAKLGDIPAIEVLLQHGANSNIRNINGRTAIDVAREFHDKETGEPIVQALSNRQTFH